ncbi:MAG TPA: hypothetical protein VI564_01930 [Candidatus Nanoarchaeia archaeon]|nr:hypothetical protein [Candidatus Nanoarchaeia archaeon]
MGANKVLTSAIAAWLAVSSASSLSCVDNAPSQNNKNKAAAAQNLQSSDLERVLSHFNRFSGEEVVSLSNEIITEKYSGYKINEIQFITGALKDGKAIRKYLEDYEPQYIVSGGKLVFNGGYDGCAYIDDPTHWIGANHPNYFVPIIEVFEGGKPIKQYGIFFHTEKEGIDRHVNVVRLPDKDKLLLNPNQFQNMHPDVRKERIATYNQFIPKNMQDAAPIP